MEAEGEKRVTFNFDGVESEETRLLNGDDSQATTAPLVFGAMVSEPNPATAAQPLAAVKRPDDLQTIPEDFFLWPCDGIKIACPHW